MNPKVEKIFHDLRAPLARAKTITKLLMEDNPLDQEYLPVLLASLEAVDSEMSKLQNSLKKD